jgi:hypothetical protein
MRGGSGTGCSPYPGRFGLLGLARAGYPDVWRWPESKQARLQHGEHQDSRRATERQNRFDCARAKISQRFRIQIDRSAFVQRHKQRFERSVVRNFLCDPSWILVFSVLSPCLLSGGGSAS